MNVPKRTIYDICQRVDSSKSITRKPGSGRPAKKMPKKKVMSLVADAHGKLGVSLRKLGRKYKIDKKYVSNILKKEGVSRKVRKTAPKYTNKQKSEQKKKLRQLSENEFAPSNGLEIIIDDESFFTLDGSDTANNRHYYCKSGQVVDTEVYFKRKKKFVSKVLVWVAISPRGHSAAYICPSGNSVNAQIYEKYCIRSRLRRFINDKHADGQFIFWPDMATAHYAGSVIQAYNELQIKYIEKSRNVPNVPQLRPIERFWRHLKREVYSGGWEASTTDELKARIRQKLRQIPSTVYVHMMRRVKTKIRQASRHGADFVI
ncbi:hypothetical protein Zmor_027932 [Zophobas morio]|uniref:Tc1-like transposase DDE domain-containing protein n=1 Tax=Zophobas morio TaxID=2755281 RepID=A0AA38HPH8_9CUCU|nr:hypothetical protein Zmor_027932 [Zophobas morio]